MEADFITLVAVRTNYKGVRTRLLKSGINRLSLELCDDLGWGVAAGVEEFALKDDCPTIVEPYHPQPIPQ